MNNRTVIELLRGFGHVGDLAAEFFAVVDILHLRDDLDIRGSGGRGKLKRQRKPAGNIALQTACVTTSSVHLKSRELFV
jgi:hypothetical protein